jgi:cytochrome P450
MDATLRLIDARIDGSAPDRDDILSDLLHARLPDGGRLSRDEVVGEVVQLLYAGHHTIPWCLTWFFTDLAAHGDVAGRVADEAVGLLARGDPGPAELAASYCLAALEESMRLHPAAPLLYREVARPFELGGFAFPAGALVWVSPALLHTDARWFPDPERFRPERFLERGTGDSGEHAYLPFGAGPRTCVGNHQASLQMTVTALHVAGRFALAPLSGDSGAFSVRARP